MIRLAWLFCTPSFIFLLVPSGAGAVTLGQIDTFQNGTTMGWSVPGAPPNPPTTITNGGPGGVSDAFLQLTAIGGAGAGSRLSVLNGAQWAGDYLASGVFRIRMDVNNFGPDDLALRLLFETTDGAQPTNLALSAQAIVVPAGSGWMTVHFPITPGDLVVDTVGTTSGALADTTRLRIFHNPAAAFPGPGVGIPPVTATLGVDNIAAVPEPASAGVFVSGLILLLGMRPRRGAQM